jgi:C1A family cysteine protease
MSTELPKDLQLNPLRRTLTNRRDFVAGLTTASAFSPLLSRQAAASPTPPPRYDLRAVPVSGSNYITEVRDQGECNSCTAFAVIAAIEGAISVKQDISNPTIHLSEEQLFSCAGPGCDTNAWYPDEALRYCKNTGVANYSVFGPRDGTCHTDINWSLQRISDYIRLPNAQAMKEWISGTGTNAQPSPVISLFVFYQDLWDYAPSNTHEVYRHNDKGPRTVTCIGGHAVCIVGYQDNPGYWICKNSFGPNWGGAGKGFFNIAYGDCHIDDFRMYGVILP